MCQAKIRTTSDILSPQALHDGVATRHHLPTHREHLQSGFQWLRDSIDFGCVFLLTLDDVKILGFPSCSQALSSISVMIVAGNAGPWVSSCPSFLPSCFVSSMMCFLSLSRKLSNASPCYSLIPCLSCGLLNPSTVVSWCAHSMPCMPLIFTWCSLLVWCLVCLSHRFHLISLRLLRGPCSQGFLGCLAWDVKEKHD